MAPIRCPATPTGAFIFQHPILVAGALILRPMPLNADLKYPLLAAGTLIGVFAMIHYLKVHAVPRALTVGART